MPLTCADLFCGAGGFSEGFRQAGFRVTKALDNWAPAVLTHEKNHPDTLAINGDILTYRPEDLGPIDVLIGSPPCTEFSFANRGGGGDIEAGMRLIYRFLRFVYELQPKWWVMENVPRTLEYLDHEIPLRKLGIDKRGVLEIPHLEVFVSSDYGTPQKRARAFSGNFPLPPQTHAEHATAARARWRTLRDVVDGLPDPRHRLALGENVSDPVYGFDLPAHHLTDHFSTRLELTEEEVRENRKAKEEHSWYGRMAFPDDLDRPARTVMATQLRVSRETTVIASSTGGYRRLSVREASSVQAFPITYQWWGKTEAMKYKLIGNAVAPPVAFAVAKAIVRAAERPVPQRPHVIRTVHTPVPDVIVGEKGPRKLKLVRKFRDHVPGSRVAGFRVDLDNLGEAPAKARGWRAGRSAPLHVVEWRAVLYRGSGKAVKSAPTGLQASCEYLAAGLVDERSIEHAQTFVRALEEAFAATVPDASTLQAVRAERLQLDVTPYSLLDRISELVREHFKSSPAVVTFRTRAQDYLPRRTAAYLVATAYVCTLANKGTAWLAAHPEAAFSPVEGASRRPARPSVDSVRLDRVFKRALSKHRPRTKRERDARVEIEQLTITGA